MAIKIGAQKFWPSYHYSSVVQTAMHSNWNLQKLLKSFMRYCNLKFGYNKATCKIYRFANLNCAGKKKHTLPIKTTPKPNGT